MKGWQSVGYAGIIALALQGETLCLSVLLVSGLIFIGGVTGAVIVDKSVLRGWRALMFCCASVFSVALILSDALIM